MKLVARYLQPLVMVLLALLGLFAALGHHLYYRRLRGQEVQNAQWPPRFGIALAFFIKLALLTAVDIAYKQQAWVSLIFASLYLRYFLLF